MKGLIVNVVLGGALFAGSLLGALAATGRLNHDGVANIPVLNGLFPEPPADPAADPNADPNAAGGHDGAANGAADASGKHDGAASDAAHEGGVDAAGADHAAKPEAGQEPQRQGQEPSARGAGGETSGGDKPLKRGKSIFQTEPPAGGGEHGGGGGEHGGGGENAGGEHGAKEEKPAHGGEHAAKEDKGHGGKPAPDAGHGGEHAAERDFDRIADELSKDRASRYAPGGYFRFDGMPAGVTPQKLDEAWKRVQEVMADLDGREKALDLRQKELREFADDIARRQTELGRERVEVENLQRKLDERIERFQQQVKLIRTDEVAGLKRNAQSLASFEPSKVADMFKDQWRTEAGQDEVLKTLEYMDKDTVNSILQALPKELLPEVLQKRLKVSVEPATPSASGK